MIMKRLAALLLVGGCLAATPLHAESRREQIEQVAAFVPMPGEQTPPTISSGCPGSTNFAQDNFNGGDGVTLSSHSDTLGNSWSNVLGSGQLLQNAQSPAGVGVNTLSDFEGALDSGTPTCANYTVKGTANNPGNSNGGAAGIICRGVGTGATLDGYIALANYFSFNYIIGKITNGSVSTLTSGGSSSGASAKALAFTCSGSTLSLTVGGTATLSTTDSTYSAAGKSGVAVQGNDGGRNAYWLSVFSAQ